MRTPLILLMGVLTGAGVALAARPAEHPTNAAGLGTPVASDAAIAPTTDDAARDRVDELDTQVARLTQRLALLQMSRDKPAPADDGSDAASIQRAVAELLEARLSGAEVAPRSPLADMTPAALADLLMQHLVDRSAAANLWDEIRHDGRHVDVVEVLAQRWEQDPNNVDLGYQVGEGHLRVALAQIGPGARIAAEKADAAFAKVLALEPDHWDARFTRGVNLALSPSMWSQSGEALRQFEALVETQTRLPAERRHAQTFLYLGNLYRQQGDEGRALEAWRQGLENFPESNSLRKQLELYQR